MGAATVRKGVAICFGLLILLSSIPAAVYAVGPNNHLQYQSGMNLTTPSSNGPVSGQQISNSIYDASGNHYLAGTFYAGTYTIDPSHAPLTFDNDTAYIIKYNASGTVAWIRYVSTTDPLSQSATYSVVFDAASNVYWSGLYSGTVTLDGPGGSSTVSTPSGQPNAPRSTFMMKLSGAGAINWLTHADNASGGEIGYGKPLITPDGTLYSTGYIQGTAAIDASQSNVVTSSIGGADLYIFKFSAAGVPSVITHVTDSAGGYIYPRVSVVSSTGRIVISYDTSAGAVIVRNDGSTQSLDPGGSYITAFEADGSYAWSHTLSIGTNALLALPNGGLIMGGIYSSGDVIGTEQLSGRGGLIATLASDGSVGWVRTLPAADTNSYAYVTGLNRDASGRLYVVGSIAGRASFGTPAHTVQPGVNEDGFVATYSPDATPDWVDFFVSDPSAGTGYYSATPNGVNVLANGALEVYGNYMGNIEFNNTDGTVTRYDQLTTPGYQLPSFIARFTVYVPTSTPIPAASQTGAIGNTSSSKTGIFAVIPPNTTFPASENTAEPPAATNDVNSRSAVLATTFKPAQTLPAPTDTGSVLPYVVCGGVVIFGGLGWFVLAAAKRRKKR